MKLRLVIRARDRGPVGFVNLTAPAPSEPAGGVTYTLVRCAISEQLAIAGPDGSYVFLLDGGVPVAPSQEDQEVAEGVTDCFIAFSSGGSTLYGAAAAASPGGLQDNPLWPQQMLSNVPSRTIVQQWVESFAFMGAPEQQEALSYLQLCFPAAWLGAALASTSPARSTARHASSTPTGSGARRTPRQGCSTPQLPSSNQAPPPPPSASPKRRSLSGAPRAPQWQSSPHSGSGAAGGVGGSAVCAVTDGAVPEGGGAVPEGDEAVPDGTEGAAHEDGAKSIDVMLDVGDAELKADTWLRKGDDFMIDSGSSGLEAADLSLDSQLLELYNSQIGNSLNASSSIFSASASTPAVGGGKQSPSTSPVKAAMTEAASPRRRASPRASTYLEDTVASALRNMQHNQRNSHGAGSPGAHATTSPRKQGRGGSPIKPPEPASIAFGSRRPQRPSTAGMMATGAVPHLGRHNSITGIF